MEAKTERGKEIQRMIKATILVSNTNTFPNNDIDFRYFLFSNDISYSAMRGFNKKISGNFVFIRDNDKT